MEETIQGTHKTKIFIEQYEQVRRQVKINTISSRFFVREWQMVTVAWAQVNKLAIGEPYEKNTKTNCIQ